MAENAVIPTSHDRSVKGFTVFRALLVAGVLILSLLIRITYQNHTVVDIPLRADARDYFAYAKNLYVHGVYSHQLDSAERPVPDAKRPPAYGLFLSAFFPFSETFEGFYRRVLLTQAFIDTLTVLLAFLLASTVLTYWAALGTSFLLAINAHMAVMTGYLLSETLYTFFLAAAMLFSALALKRDRLALIALAGCFFGLATLTRSVLMVFPFLIAGYSWHRYRRQADRRSLKLAFALLGGFLVTVSPWVARNFSIEPPSDPALNISRMSFVHGSYPNFIYRSKVFYGYPYKEDPRDDYMYESWSNTFEILAERAKAEPLKYVLWYGGGKVAALWGWDLLPGGAGDLYSYPYLKSGFVDVRGLRLVRSVSRIVHWPLVVLGYIVLAWYLLWGGWKKVDEPVLAVCIMLIAYFSAIHTVLGPFPRYSIPLRPYLFIVALYALSFLPARQANRQPEAK